MAREAKVYMRRDRFVAIAVLTSGPLAYYHEIIKISAVLLNSRSEAVRDHIPFDLWLKPDYPERVNVKLTVNQKSALERAIPKWQTLELFENWLTGCAPEGGHLRIVGYDVASWLHMFIEYCCESTYEHYFSRHHVDICCLAQGLNEMADIRGLHPPYPILDLTYLAARHHCGRRHTQAQTLQEALVITDVFRRMAEDPFAIASTSILARQASAQDEGPDRRVSSSHDVPEVM